MRPIDASAVSAIRRAASDVQAVNGLTHTFYKYPARFSPSFVASAIQHFSKEGDIVLDPYMGGGTTVVEAFARNRHAVGSDLNSLAVFISRVKTTFLNLEEQQRVRRWMRDVIPTLSYRAESDDIGNVICEFRTRNLSIPRARPAKKLLALALSSLDELGSLRTQDFVRAVLLNVAQWALNNRKRAPTLDEIRARIARTGQTMLQGLEELQRATRSGRVTAEPILIHGTAEHLPVQRPFSDGKRASLVVTSPPYPGIHLLYHRWQIDGRRETPAPYWIADCYDGKGASFYNFAGRYDEQVDDYFIESLCTLRAIRKVLKHGAVMVQMIAFSKPRSQLPRYLKNMEKAGYEEIRTKADEDDVAEFQRIWRSVPGRAWYAAQKGETTSSREVVLIHRAV